MRKSYIISMSYLFLSCTEQNDIFWNNTRQANNESIYNEYLVKQILKEA